MSVYLTIPSARPPEEAIPIFQKWKAQGYKIALWLDEVPNPTIAHDQTKINYWISGGRNYPGYSHAVNALIADVMQQDPQAEWCVIGGDDVEPDPNHTAEEIARQCREHFRELKIVVPRVEPTLYAGGLFGVMQPTGDRFANGSIDKVAGSAWIGREFARRMYRGDGPLWPEYTRFFMDEELQAVAIKYGVFQQRLDLIHLHRHYTRESGALNAEAVFAEIPAHLKAQELRWKDEQDIFNRRKHARPTAWPGSEPIA